MPKRLPTGQVFAENLQRLIDHHNISQAELARRSGVAQTLLSGFLKKELGAAKNPTSSTIDKLAGHFKVAPWQLLIPDISLDLLLNERLATLIENFRDAPEDGRANIERIAQSELRYASANREQPSKTGTCP